MRYFVFEWLQNLKGFPVYFSQQAATAYRKALADAVCEAREAGFPFVVQKEEEGQTKGTETFSKWYAFHSHEKP